MAQKQNDLVLLGGLWKQTNDRGTTYLSGRLGAARVLIFANTRRENDKQPSHLMYLAPAERKDENQRGDDDRRDDQADDDIPF